MDRRSNQPHINSDAASCLAGASPFRRTRVSIYPSYTLKPFTGCTVAGFAEAA
jgi:hypothetical protein